MKQKLRKYLEDNFQSVDQLKDLADDLRMVSFAIDGAVIPDSHKDINLQFARQMTANVLSTAVCKNDQTPESIESIRKIKKIIEEKEKKLSKIEIDLSQPIKELKRYNKQLSKSIESQAEFKENKSEFKIEKTRSNTSRALTEFFEKEKNEAIAKDLEEDVKALESVLNECEAHLAENAKEGRTSCNMEEAHNAITCLTQNNIRIAKILQKHISNGNV